MGGVGIKKRANTKKVGELLLPPYLPKRLCLPVFVPFDLDWQMAEDSPGAFVYNRSPEPKIPQLGQ
jgi:hypothetical protein